MGDGQFGALLNVSYAQTRYRDQSVTAGALVPFATVDDPAAGSGRCGGQLREHATQQSELDTARTHLQRPIAVYWARRRSIWQAGSTRPAAGRRARRLRLHGVDYPYLLARDALFASDFQGDRERPAANVALQWAPNDTSEYTFESFYQGYREEMFNNLHFTFADWWGRPRPGSRLDHHDVSGHEPHQDARGFPFGFNSGDSTRADTDSYVYALNGKWDDQ